MNILQTLSDKELLNGYKSIILYYELNIANSAIKNFDARKPKWRQYRKKYHKLRLKPLNSGYTSKFRTITEPFFCFNNLKKEPRTQALFRHLRNAYAHGNVEKVKINNKWWYYCFEDKNDSGKVTMQGQIPTGKLKELIQELKENQK